MKAYKRIDFLKLPEDTIYSRIQGDYPLLSGLYCKTSGADYDSDWVEQDLIASNGYPNDITEGQDAVDYQVNLRDTFQEFRTDLNCGGRDGMFRDSDVFVVWDKEDVTKLRDYLNIALEQ